MVSKRGRQLERAIDELLQASAELRKTLVRYERANRSLSRLVREGVPVIEALERIEANELRPALSAALERIDGARHAGRLAVLALASEEGSSISDVARAFRISRQLASRLAAEVRK
jgi:type II secretory pathway component PulF